ncbi:hypothetical protein Acr_21g0001950 [Actinidia rufa]|uniref:Uncharacterized protein n=1 Tax=Actinidia rufa TaxID=165716 RepID=A0A7J0GFM1_9ERIC|nr:hypothetical protein Acr_21g0001950 [Actinidia rufa]
MSCNSGVTRSGDLDSLPSWISDHLGEGSSFMTDEVNQSPASSMEGSPPPETNPLAAIHPSVEEKTNIITLEELEALREAYYFPPRVQVRLPEEGETITSTRPSELVLNAWRSIVCSMAMWRVFKYTLSISEFRNLFSLNSNPKPDQGWLYFKARNKKALLGGYPNNVKGWKSKFFFVSGDEWALPEGSPLEGAPRVPRAWGFQISTATIHLGYTTTSQKFFRRFSNRSRRQGASLYRCCWSRNCSTAYLFLPDPWLRGLQARNVQPAKHQLVRRRRTEEDLASHPRPDPFEVSGGKVFDPIFNWNPSSGSNPTSKSCSDSSQPVELDSDAMSKRISFKKLGEKLEKLKNGSSSGIPAPAKGLVIGEKHAEENLASSASKRGKVDDGSKGKRVDREPEGKKKATSPTNAPTTPATASSRLGEGTSATIGAALGPTASILGSPSVAEKLLRGMIPPADKEKVEKLTLDQTATKLFHVIGQASFQEGRAASMETEVARLQKLSAVLKQQLAEARVHEQQANDELAKTKSDRDSLADKVKRSGVLVVELREALSKAKESAVEEFKSSSEFMVAIEDSASKYFGEGFDFCKVQLRRHHPDLAIDLEGTMVDQDLLAEQDEVAEEKEKEKVSENEGGEKDTTPL